MKISKKHFIWQSFIVIGLLGIETVKSQNAPDSRYVAQSVRELHALFRYSAEDAPMVCAHRGGADKGLPENSIATFEHTSSLEPVFFEVDPRLTKDSVVVVLHDATLDRTTTGHGNLSDYTYEELQSLFLKDKDGNVTTHKIPLLEDIIKWGKARTTLLLDKKDVPLPMLYDIITKNKAESHIIVSAYSVEEAAFYHDRNKDIMIEAFVTNEKRLQQYDESGISWKNIIAYVGQPKSKTLYKKIHERGAKIIVFTSRVQDKLPDEMERRKAYREIIRNGADILMSDRPIEVVRAIR